MKYQKNRIGITLSNEMYEMLENCSRWSGMSKSNVLIMAFSMYLKDNEVILNACKNEEKKIPVEVPEN